MRFYAIFNIPVLVGVLLLMQAHREVLWFGIGGEIAAILLANGAASVSMNRRIAEIFFLNENFTVLTVGDLLYDKEKKPFPLRFANPVRQGDKIQFHFTDNILQIQKEDWPEFELLWHRFNLDPGPQVRYTVV